MLVYNTKDYHYYNKILNFVDLFPDCKKNRINEVNNDYFKNIKYLKNLIILFCLKT